MKLSRFFHLWNCNAYWLLQPRNCRNNSGLGYFHFARHYFGNRLFLSLPAGTKMFQFSAFAHLIKCIQSSTVWVAPFGYRRIISCWQIPVAFRSLPRPSSPPKAQASSVRSCLLRLTCVYFALEWSLNSLEFEIVVPNLSKKITDFLFFYLVISLITSNNFFRFVASIIRSFLKRAAKVGTFF